MTRRSRFPGLNRPNSQEFLDELDNYSSSLTIKDSQPFFEHLLNLFQTHQINPNVGNEILLSIYQIIEDPKFKQQFIKNEMISFLPFNSPKSGINYDCFDNILNILSSLISDDQSTSQILQFDLLKTLTSFSPYKTIILISKIVSRSQINSVYFSNRNTKDDEYDESNSWVNILINNNAFCTNDCVSSYVSLLLKLLDNSAFYSDFASSVWSTIVNLTSDEYPESIINSLYFSLCYMIDEKSYVNGAIRGDTIADDILNPNLKKSAISLLLRCKLSKGVTEDLVRSLITVAQTDPKALLVLNRVAETQKGALCLINESSWMGKKLPDIQSTLDLFLVLFTQPYLKMKIMEKTTDVVIFLNLVLSIPDDLAPQGNKRSRDKALKDLDAEIIPILCTILRRMEPTEELVNEMSQQNFLNEYLLRCDRNELHFYGIHLISQIVNAQIYTEELLTACDILLSIIKADQPGRDYDFAITTAKEMCVFRQCKRRLKASKIDQFIRNGNELTRLQRAFLRELTTNS